MSKLQRCVIRDELVADAKRIQQRYALRSWGDAVNMIFAAHRQAYLASSHSVLPTNDTFLPTHRPTLVSTGVTTVATLSDASQDAADSNSINNDGDLRSFLSDLNCSLPEDS